jgi:hypothetical protein
VVNAAPRLAYSGPARKLTEIDFTRAAQRSGLGVAIIKAVDLVESAGSGFLSDGSGRPVILYEAHRFSKETGGDFDRNYPKLSVPSWDRSLYLGGAREYERLNAAALLDEQAALKATSWGRFQILGSNHSAVGYPDVRSYVEAMTQSEGAHLDAFIGFIQANNLVRPLKALDWATFARGYNGTQYRLNKYDEKLAEAYARLTGWPIPMPAALRIGASGEPVKQLQQALIKAGWRLAVDGQFGRATEIAVEQFQASRGLVSDGIAGPLTYAALGL